MSTLHDTSFAIGPLNTAGQAYQWSEAVHRELCVSSWSFAGTRRRTRRVDGRAHRLIPHHAVRPRALRRLAVERLLRSRTHVLSESLLPLLGDPRTVLLADELAELSRRGIVLGAVFHGSDIRDPERHMAALPYSYFRLGEETWRSALASAARRRRDSVEAMGMAAYVSTPDLLLDLPGASWLPLVVDRELWATAVPPFRTRRPVVLHLPSRRTPAIKGTGFIDPILRDLDRSGRIEYRSPTSVPHRDVPALVRGADIVVEQILAGSYGVAAVEAMAAGRLVIGNVGPETRAVMSEAPPILDATPDTLADVLSQVLASPHQYSERAADGPGYVSRIHSGARSARALQPFLNMAGSSPGGRTACAENQAHSQRPT